MEERELVQKVDRLPLELMEEAEERQKEGEDNLAALERAGKTIIAFYGCA